jgi:TetR/AcrR family transcriptional regulator, cholesterol catabolism regulator
MKQTRREEIIQAATQLFREKGYGAATMRDLAEMVGIEAASLYNHIKSKEEILKLICFETAKKYVVQLDFIEKKETNSVEKLRALLKLHILMVTDAKDAVFVCNNEYKHLTEPYLSDFQKIRRGYEKRFLAIIETGIENGELKKVDSAIALYTFLSAVRWLEIWYRPERKIGAEQLQNDVCEVLLSGLVK